MSLYDSDAHQVGIKCVAIYSLGLNLGTIGIYGID